MKNFSLPLILLSVFIFTQSLIASTIPTSVEPHGVFTPKITDRSDDNKVYSPNGRYWAEFIRTMDENMRLSVAEVRVYDRTNLLYTKATVPGAPDLEISNAGFLRAGRLQYKESGDLTITIYTPNGDIHLQKVFQKAGLFGFSPTGDKYAVGMHKKLEVYSLTSQKIETYPETHQFAISHDGSSVAIATNDGVKLFKNEKFVAHLKEDIYVGYVREIRFTPDGSKVAFFGKRTFAVYNTTDGSRSFVDKVSGFHSFVDLHATNETIYTGIHLRNSETKVSHGVMREYSLDSRKATAEREYSKRVYALDYSNVKEQYGRKGKKYTIPWPFDPPTQMQYPWNGYCQAVGASTGTGSGSYLHQGLDMDVKSNQKCYAVEDGFAKCYQTMSGALHWRTAVCTVNVAEAADGWLYAHLVERTITKRPGDLVERGEYLGDIVHWSSQLVNGAHLHFSYVRDNGIQWSVTDANEWDNICNPMTYLSPNTDTDAPTLMNVNNAKIAFTNNDVNGNGQFLDPMNLQGDVDVYLHVADKVGDSPWEQPAYSIIYWLRRVSDGKLFQDRTVGNVRNQYMNRYSSGSNTDYKLLLHVMYRLDNSHPAIGWFDKNRHHLQNITNSNGDSTFTRQGKQYAFDTKKYGDGEFWFCVEVADIAGNKTLDSIKVNFNNGIVAIDKQAQAATHFAVNNATYNKLQSSGTISFSVPQTAEVSLKLFNAAGVEVQTLTNRKFQKGHHRVNWKNSIGSGMYFIQMKSKSFTGIKKFMVR